jgi:hypothetical protein
MTFWETVGEAALTWVIYSWVLLSSNFWGGICGEEWRANGCKLRHSGGVLKGWLAMVFVFLVVYLYPLLEDEPDAAWALGAFGVISLTYFFAASGGGPVTEDWIRNALWQAGKKSLEAKDAQANQDERRR